MKRFIFLATIGLVALYSFALSGCSVTIALSMPTPSITAAIATPIPALAFEPTLTPLPLLPSATFAPATATATTVPSVTPMPIVSAISQPVTPTQTPQPPPPPPAQPTKVVLPQLAVFDKDGNNMEGKVLGVSVPKSLMSFQVTVCSPDCKSKSDGSGVTSVDFEFYKGTTHKRADLEGKNPVYKTTEHNKPYCAFGGDSPCPNWIFSEHGGKWPNGANIDGGDYTLLLRAFGDNKNNAFWTSVINFSIQR
jgi:hypothetical protein